MLESVLLVLALSLDAFAASIAYGTNHIDIPINSILVIDFICTFFLGISLLFGSMIRMIMPGDILIVISFTTLALLGIYYLFESIIRASLRKNRGLNKKVRLKLFDLRFIVEIYADETKADANYSKRLSSKEATYLAVVLSLDSLAAGFSSSIVDINCWQVILFSLIFGIFAIWSGLFVGRRLAKRSNIDISWVSGIILITLAIMKLI